MSDTFSAEYIGNGCFRRVSTRDDKNELAFVNQANREVYGHPLTVGNLYRLGVQKVPFGVLYLIVEEVSRV